MNIFEIKELEDLKVEKKKILYRLSQKVDKMVKEKLEYSKSEFLEFFNNYKFVTNSQGSDSGGTILKANYKDFKILLTVPDHSQRFIGFVSEMDLFVAKSRNKVYTIVLSKNKSCSSSGKSLKEAKQSKDSIRGEIEKLKEEINSLIDEIDNFSTKNYYFTYFEGHDAKFNSDKEIPEDRQYQDINKILGNIFAVH